MGRAVKLRNTQRNSRLSSRLDTDYAHRELENAPSRSIRGGVKETLSLLYSILTALLMRAGPADASLCNEIYLNAHQRYAANTGYHSATSSELIFGGRCSGSVREVPAGLHSQLSTSPPPPPPPATTTTTTTTSASPPTPTPSIKQTAGTYEYMGCFEYVSLFQHVNDPLNSRLILETALLRHGVHWPTA